MAFANTLTLQSPGWLWLLGALAIPVLIHLVRRSAPREITFAAVQWLQQERQRQWQRLFLRDRWLLLLRMLLLALLALLVASPLYQRPAQRSDRILLVDPAVADESLQNFLAAHPQIARVYWLQSEPTEISARRPAAVDIGQTLTRLASAGEFRRAQILLQQAQFPGSHQTLYVSPHWQWHSITAAEADIALPTLAIAGSAPQWLEPALKQLSLSEPQQYSAQSEIDPRNVDWLIYDTAGGLPPQIQTFVSGGGLLISDARVSSTGDPEFVEIEPGLEAAAIGRGSWLRYRDNWHEETFYRNPQLPQQLWQQWSAQDWQWQFRSRDHWLTDGTAGIAVSDTEITQPFQYALRSALLLAFALLLLLERAIALSRRDTQGEAGTPVDGGSGD